MRWLIPFLLLLGACVTTLPSKPVDRSDTLDAAMTMCGIHDSMVAKLKADYGEVQVWIAMLENELVLEMFVSEGNTFTMLVTNGQGLACLFGSGRSYHPFSGQLPIQTLPKTPSISTPSLVM
jgi:hypothetical protein